MQCPLRTLHTSQRSKNWTGEARKRQKEKMNVILQERFRTTGRETERERESSSSRSCLMEKTEVGSGVAAHATFPSSSPLPFLFSLFITAAIIDSVFLPPWGKSKWDHLPPPEHERTTRASEIQPECRSGPNSSLELCSLDCGF